MDIKKFEEVMSVYGFGMHQDFVTYRTLLKNSGFTIQDAFEYVQIKKIELDLERKKLEVASQICPSCNGTMRIFAVNHSQATQTDDPTEHSVWLCQNNNCMHTIYNKESINDIIRKGGN